MRGGPARGGGGGGGIPAIQQTHIKHQCSFLTPFATSRLVLRHMIAHLAGLAAAGGAGVLGAAGRAAGPVEGREEGRAGGLAGVLGAAGAAWGP